MDLEFDETPPPRRSLFVNALAWIFIVLGGFTTAISILQVVMVRMMLRKEEVSRALEQAEQAKRMPAPLGFLFAHIDLYFAAVFVVSLVTLVSAVALLRRKNWARIVFIVLMSLGIAWNLAGLGFQLTVFDGMPHLASDGFAKDFERMILVLKIASVTMVVVFSVLFGWVIKRLVSPEVKEEFRQGA